MPLTEARTRSPSILPPPADGPRIWGLGAGRLHDLFWAARGIQVVRPGQPPDPRGPGVFLLLRAGQAILAPAAPWLKRLAWAGCPVLGLRIVDRSGVEYRERVISSATDNLLSIHRVYPRRQGNVGQVLLTTDARAAHTWASFEPGRERWSALRRSEPRLQRAVWSSDGRLFELSTHRLRSVLLDALVATWRDPGRIIPGIYQPRPGVWVHETTPLSPSARMVGPIWIGAVARAATPGPVIGPVAVEDSCDCDPPSHIDWDALRLPSFPLVPRVHGFSRRVSKRAFDIVMSLCVLAMTLPFYPLFMLAIYLEDGRPFFFAHRRQTLDGREFPCWKFRTMVKDAERLKAALQTQNVCDGPQFFIAHDPRVLHCGRWFRRLQIDELPQFWNVLQGHMSIVGPRPSPDKENQFCPAWREARLSIRPGITGLWQVRRTRLPATDFQEWVRYDLEYVQHQSWRLDFWIIVQTVRRILAG